MTHHTSTVLSVVQQRVQSSVKFDPYVKEHVLAYRMLAAGKQHPTLRFTLEHPFSDIFSMMQSKIGVAFAQMVGVEPIVHNIESYASFNPSRTTDIAA